VEPRQVQEGDLLDMNELSTGETTEESDGPREREHDLWDLDETTTLGEDNYRRRKRRRSMR